MMKQRVCGVIMLLLCLVLILVAAGGETVEERDVTATAFLVPLGFYMMFTRKRIMYDLSGRRADREQVTGDVCDR